ncbi:hypothetical protein HYQ46_000893 [Verticillium longisporum]|nr:hypothetical protein HYQ46_000893 [Verticillium longisporum]
MVDGFHAEHDRIRRKLDVASTARHLVPHLAHLRILEPRGVAHRRFAEEILNSLGVLQAGRVNHEHGQRLNYHVEEKPVADTLIGQIGSILSASLVILEILERS